MSKHTPPPLPIQASTIDKKALNRLLMHRPPAPHALVEPTEDERLRLNEAYVRATRP